MNTWNSWHGYMKQLTEMFILRSTTLY